MSCVLAGRWWRITGQYIYRLDVLLRHAWSKKPTRARPMVGVGCCEMKSTRIGVKDLVFPARTPLSPPDNHPRLLIAERMSRALDRVLKPPTDSRLSNHSQ